MRPKLSVVLLTLMLLCSSSIESVAQKKKNPAVPATPIDSEKLTPGTFVGILKTTPNSNRTFTVEIETQTLVPTKKQSNRTAARGGRAGNPANRVLQIQRQLTQAQQRALRARTPQQRTTAMQQVLRSQVQLQQALVRAQRSGGLAVGYRINTTRQSVEFQAAEKVKVRTLMLPEEFDNKGNIKKYTQKELAELRGKDTHLPGYESSLDKLQVGTVVRVHLARAGQQPAAKEEDPDLAGLDRKMQVQTIVLLKPANEAVTPPRRKPAK